MEKRISFLTKIFVASFFLITIFSSCGNQLQPADSDKAYVTFAASISRTVFPTVTVENCTSFTLTGAASGSTETKTFGNWASYAELQKSTVEVTPGTWSFTLTATASGLTYTQTLERNVITAGSSTPLAFELSFSTFTADTKTTGTLNYTLTFPSSSSVAVVTVGLFDSSLNAVTGYEAESLTIVSNTTVSGTTTKSVTYSKENLTSGNYLVGYTIYGDEAKTVKLNSNKESVYIAAGLTSTGSAALSSINSMYTLTYSLNSGTLSITAAASTVNYSIYSSAITLPTATDITRKGYTFGGWYTDEDLTTQAEDSFVPAKNLADTTLYAKWTANPVTTFEELKTMLASGGTIPLGGNITVTEALTVSKNTTITASTAYTLTRSTFTGPMFTVSSGITFTLGSESTSTITLDGGSLSNSTGSLIDSSGILNITNVTLQNNYATYGGAIQVYSGNANINSITLSGNTATLGKDLYLYNGTTSIQGTITSTSAMDLYFNNSTSNNKPVLIPSGTITLTNGTAINVTIAKITSGMTLLTKSNDDTDGSILSSATSKFALADTTYTINTDGTIAEKVTGTAVTSYSDLQTKIEAVTSGSSASFLVSGALTANATITVKGNITIYADEAYTISRSGSGSFLTSFFTVSSGASLTLGGGNALLTIDGAKSSVSSTAPIVTDNGSLILNNNCTLQNNKSTSSTEGSMGGAILVSGDSASFTMNGGTITGNTCTGNGGGIYCSGTTATFALIGGTISSNSTSNCGGGIYCSGSIGTISGTTISGNQSTVSTGNAGGGGVYVTGSGSVTMTGGSISTNYSGYYGGGVLIDTGTFAITKGTLADNTLASSSKGANVYLISGTYTNGTTSNTTAGTAFEDAQSIN